MAVIGELLFWSGQRRRDLSDVLRHNLEKEVPSKADRLTAAQFEGTSDDALAVSLYEECKAEPIELNTADASVDVKEVQLRVRDVFGDDVTVQGLRAIKTVPFSGEAQFFNLTPSTYDVNPPRGEVRGNWLTIGMEVRESESEAAVRYIEESLASVRVCIDRQRSQIEEHNKQLPGVIAAALQRRRASSGKSADLAARLRGQ